VSDRIDRLNSEITVLQTSAKIALVNLGNVSRRVQRAFTDAELLAEKKLELRRTLLEQIPRAISAIERVEIHPLFGRKEEILGEMFDKDDIFAAQKTCLRTNEDVDRRVHELKNTMEEFILQGEALKKEVLGWEPEAVQEGGQAREISLIADKIERGTDPFEVPVN
jgi:HrpA-like RNA helicase